MVQLNRSNTQLGHDFPSVQRDVMKCLNLVDSIRKDMQRAELSYHTLRGTEARRLSYLVRQGLQHSAPLQIERHRLAVLGSRRQTFLEPKATLASMRRAGTFVRIR